MENFEIKIHKRTRADFKIFGKNRIQKFEVTHPTKFGKDETEKKRKQLIPYKGATLACYPHLSKLNPHPCPPLHAPPPPDLAIFLRSAAGPVYRLGLR
jgi:hypothetical protein